jgi:hypothetical protein
MWVYGGRSEGSGKDYVYVTLWSVLCWRDEIKINEMCGECRTVGGRERCINGFWRERLRQGDHLEGLGANGRMRLKSMGGMDWIDWLRIGRSGEPLSMQSWTFRFHKRWRISWLAENLLASQEGLWSLELIISNESKGQHFYGFLESVVI